jgi:membrane protein
MMIVWFKKTFWRLYKAAENWQQDDSATLAAAVAYYAAFSFFPLVLLLISALGFAMQFSSGAENARQELLKLLAQNASPALAEHVETVLNQVRVNAVVGGPLGLIALLLGAVGVFSQIEHAFDRIWHVPGQPWQGWWAAILNILFHRLRAFLMLLGAGAMVFTAFGAGVATSAMRAAAVELPGGVWIWNTVQIGASLVLFTLSFTLIYKVLPKAPVRWSAACWGGLLAAVLWEATRQVLTWLLVGEGYTAYGIVGSVIVLMLWIYIAGSILFLGAEYTHVLNTSKARPSGR